MAIIISNKALKLKLNPTTSQYHQFLKSFGCERFVYNFYLAEKNSFYEKEIKPLGNDKKARNAVWKTFEETPLAELKKQYPFLKEADSQGIANAYMNLRAAYQKFYSGLAKLPKFHSRKTKNSYKNSMMKQSCLNWNEHFIEVPKIGKVSFYQNKAPKWYKNRTKVCSLTFSKTPSNEIYVSILFETRVDTQEKKFNNESQAIGLDFDCDDMYIDSNRKSALKDFGFTKFKQANAQKLSHLQRQFVRKVKNSKNKEKARIKLAKFEEHIANCRKDWIEKETNRLVNSYQVIGVENLSIQGMMKGSRNAKNYQDIAWSTFVSKLEQKSQFRNCQVVKVNKFFASSQLCNCCGFKNPDVQKFHLQRWTCPQCGNEHQRDENAALNIKAEAIRVLREPEERKEKSSSKKKMSKDTSSVLSTEILANLALSLSSGIGNARNKSTHAEVV